MRLAKKVFSTAA